jgi:hypothetical protein
MRYVCNFDITFEVIKATSTCMPHAFLTRRFAHYDPRVDKNLAERRMHTFRCTAMIREADGSLAKDFVSCVGRHYSLPLFQYPRVVPVDSRVEGLVLRELAALVRNHKISRYPNTSTQQSTSK